MCRQYSNVFLHFFCSFFIRQTFFPSVRSQAARRVKAVIFFLCLGRSTILSSACLASSLSLLNFHQCVPFPTIQSRRGVELLDSNHLSIICSIFSVFLFFVLTVFMSYNFFCISNFFLISSFLSYFSYFLIYFMLFLNVFFFFLYFQREFPSFCPFRSGRCGVHLF